MHQACELSVTPVQQTEVADLWLEDCIHFCYVQLTVAMRPLAKLWQHSQGKSLDRDWFFFKSFKIWGFCCQVLGLLCFLFHPWATSISVSCIILFLFFILCFCWNLTNISISDLKIKSMITSLVLSLGWKKWIFNIRNSCCESRFFVLEEKKCSSLLQVSVLWPSRVKIPCRNGWGHWDLQQGVVNSWITGTVWGCSASLMFYRH